MLLSLCQALEETWAGVLVRESLWGFQIVAAIHILGLMLSVGTLLWFDLRLLGVSMRTIRVSEFYRRLMPWTFAGFAIMFVSGGLLFTGFATRAYGNTAFWIKMGAMALAGVNAAVYHLRTERGIAAWDTAGQPPRGARVAGLVSIVVWTAVILSGRIMSYTMF